MEIKGNVLVLHSLDNDDYIHDVVSTDPPCCVDHDGCSTQVSPSEILPRRAWHETAVDNKKKAAREPTFTLCAGKWPPSRQRRRAVAWVLLFLVRVCSEAFHSTRLQRVSPRCTSSDTL